MSDTTDQIERDLWRGDTHALIKALVDLLNALGFAPEHHASDEELGSLLDLARKVTRLYACRHCDPSHGSPHRASWGVRIAPEVDGDGQPTHLIVQPSDGAHVAQFDADWLWLLIRDRQCVHVDALPEVAPDGPAIEPQLSHRRWGRGA
jgi:hypothetical protein